MMNGQRDRATALENLVELLDYVVREQVGESLSDSMERVRRLAIERRMGLPGAEGRLTDELNRLDDVELRAVIRWLSLFFDLANLAEDQTRLEVLHRRAAGARRDGQPQDESIGEAIRELKRCGHTAADVQRWLDRLCIEPVFTAHPSEAKRRTTRQLLRRIRDRLRRRRWPLPARIRERLLAELTALWQTDLVRPERPPVLSEVDRGLLLADTLWAVIPKVYRDVRMSLGEEYPLHRFEIGSILKFGSWIGGDRDGHPFVTPEITRETLARLRRTAVRLHLNWCRNLRTQLTMSRQQVECDPRLQACVDHWAGEWAEYGDRIASVSSYEVYRRFLKLIEFRLDHDAKCEADSLGSARYQTAQEFRSDVLLLHASVAAHRGKRIADEFVQPWLDLIDTFGLHFASLDIRQNSASHARCRNELLSQLGYDESQLTDDALVSKLLETEFDGTVDRDRLSEAARDVLDTFMLLADESEVWGDDGIGTYIISMTHSVLDVITVQWLWSLAWASQPREVACPAIRIVPLFETIDDLQRAPEILERLLSLNEYHAHLSSQGPPQQMVMVGYSDSTKDGSYLTASWELHRAQERLAEIAAAHHVELTVFHGRGGALGRGGGPAARAIRSLPTKAVRGRLRVTEQGEVLSERYSDPRITYRHLEQLINATLKVSTEQPLDVDPDWIAAMNEMSAASFKAYQQLLRHSRFLDYFSAATPIDEIESLPIGSRPARRGSRESISDLRAIPWTFAWTQSRHLIPAWFGLGTAVIEFVRDTDENWRTLRKMYAEWNMFKAIIDNADLALAKADMDIVRQYAALADAHDVEEVRQVIASEYDRSRAVVLLITDQSELLEATEWLNRSIKNRNPYVDPLNLAQVLLLRRRRFDPENDELVDLVRLTIQGIASGLRTTG